MDYRFYWGQFECSPWAEAWLPCVVGLELEESNYAHVGYSATIQ